MGVLKTLTDEYFGDSIRKEDKIPIGDLDVEIVSFTDNNGIEHRHGYRVKDNGDHNEMAKTLSILIERIIEKRGLECSLNDIDVSNMTQLYYKYKFVTIFNSDVNRNFNGDISGWNVSNVKDMQNLFTRTIFNGDLSKWDVQNVENMENMFRSSDFTGENGMFKLKQGNQVSNMKGMFLYSDFRTKIDDWIVNDNCDCKDMFYGSSLEFYQNLPDWYKNREQN